MNIRTTPQSCDKCCNIGYVIKDHVKPIMQLLTNDLPQYNFKLQTTKCLNTAIMLMQFLVGEKGLQIADACDTRAVIARHTSGQDDNTKIIQELSKQLFSKREKARTLYYILLSDGYFPQSASNTNSNNNKYFPGHVFILEKVYDKQTQRHNYFFYQSYINHYTLNEHIQMNRGLKLSQARVQHLINDLSKVLKAQTWDKNNVKRWYHMTFADSSDLLGAQSQKRFYLCFRKVKTTTCLQRLERYLKGKKTAISKLVQQHGDDGEVYGDASLYDNTTGVKPLTNTQILVEIDKLLYKINENKGDQTQ